MALQNVLSYILKLDDKASGKLKGVNKTWANFANRIQKVEQAVQPLTSRVVQLTAAFASTIAITKAIRLADFQIRQQVKLQVALGENVHLWEQQLEAAAEFQKATLFTDEVTIGVRAMAFAFGVANDEMDDFVQAASTIAQLGIIQSIEQAAKQLLFLRGGTGQPLAAITRLPGVKELSTAEKQTGGVEKLINKTLGAVAQEVAKTPFGTLQQDINLINDEFERLGRVMILIIGPAINKAKEAFSAFVSRFETTIKPLVPIMVALIEPLAGILKLLITMTAVITALSVAVKVVGFLSVGLSAVASVLAFFVSGPIGVIVGIFVAIGLAVAVVVARVQPLKDAFLGILLLIAGIFVAIKEIVFELLQPLFSWISKILDKFSDWIELQTEQETLFGRLIKFLRRLQSGIKDGSLEFADIVGEARLVLFRAWLWIKTNIINALVLAWELALTGIETSWNALWGTIKVTGLMVASLLATAFTGIVLGVAKSIDKVTGLAADAVSLVNEALAESIRTDLFAQVQSGPLVDIQKQAQKDMNDAAAELASTLLEGAAAAEETVRWFIKEKAAVEGILEEERKLLDIEQQRRREARVTAEDEAREETEARIALLRDLRIEAERRNANVLLSIVKRRVVEEGSIQATAFAENNKELLALSKRLSVDQISLAENEAREIEKKITDILDATSVQRQNALREQFDDGEIEAKKFYKENEALASEAHDRQIKLFEEELDFRLEQIEIELAKRLDAEALEADGIKNLTRLQEQASDFALKLILARIDKEDALAKLRTDAEKEITKEMEKQKDLAKKIAEFRRDLLTRDLVAQELEFEAAMQDAANALTESMGKAFELLGFDAFGAPLKTFLKELSLAQEVAALDEVKKIVEELKDAEDAYGDELERRNVMVKMGLILQNEANDLNAESIRSLIALTEAQTKDLQAFRIRIEAMKEFAEAPEVLEAIGRGLDVLSLKLLQLQLQLRQSTATFSDGIKDGFREWIAEAEINFAKGVEIAQNLADTIGNNLTSALTDAILGVKSLKDAFLDFARGTIEQIVRMIIQMLIFRALSGPFGFAAGIPAAGANKGGLITRLLGNVMRFGRGDLVPGGGPNRDSVPALLTPGEYVLNRHATQRAGLPFLHALNRGLVPASVLSGYRAAAAYKPSVNRLNRGGAVGGNAGPGTIPIMVASEENVEQLMTGMSNQLLEFMREHADVILGQERSVG